MNETLIPGRRYDLHLLECIGWTDGDGSGHEGYSWTDYFGADGVYRGPDAHGIEPRCIVYANWTAKLIAANVD